MNRLKSFRNEWSLSQTEAAEICGVSQSTISRLEASSDELPRLIRIAIQDYEERRHERTARSKFMELLHRAQLGEKDLPARQLVGHLAGGFHTSQLLGEFLLQEVMPKLHELSDEYPTLAATLRRLRNQLADRDLRDVVQENHVDVPGLGERNLTLWWRMDLDWRLYQVLVKDPDNPKDVRLLDLEWVNSLGPGNELQLLDWRKSWKEDWDRYPPNAMKAGMFIKQWAYTQLSIHMDMLYPERISSPWPESDLSD